MKDDRERAFPGWHAATRELCVASIVMGALGIAAGASGLALWAWIFGAVPECN